MASKTQRYEYTHNWLREQGYMQAQGLVQSNQDSYTPDALNDQQVEQQYREWSMYMDMEQGR